MVGCGRLGLDDDVVAVVTRCRVEGSAARHERQTRWSRRGEQRAGEGALRHGNRRGAYRPGSPAAEASEDGDLVTDLEAGEVVERSGSQAGVEVTHDDSDLRAAIMARLVRRLGAPVPGLAPMGLTHTFPTAEAMADADLDDLDLGMPLGRAESIRAFAQAVATDDIRLDRSVGLGHLVRSISAIPGIGRSTAHYIALRLGEGDAFPATKLAPGRELRAAVAHPPGGGRTMAPMAGGRSHAPVAGREPQTPRPRRRRLTRATARRGSTAGACRLRRGGRRLPR
jgi:hypothetical protein